MYFGVGLAYTGIVLFLVSMTVGTSLADNATVDDKNELLSAIATANAKLGSAVAGNGPGNYPQSAIDTFEAAIAIAQEVFDDPDATTEQVDKAVSDLEDAEAVFDAAQISSVNKASLISAISSASAKVEGAVAGREPGQYPQAAINAFNRAISSAQRVANDNDTTQAEVDQALSDLQAAETVFDAAKIVNVNKAALTLAISGASSKSETAIAGSGVGQYPQSAIDAFRAAIDKAQAVVSDASATQAEVDQAVKDLRTAEATFDMARIKQGDSTPPASISYLEDSAAGPAWIRWTWTNPEDPDFSHVMVYIDGSFVTTTSDNYYELTGLTEGTTYTIGIKTVDTSGNINPELVSASATTTTTPTTLPEITGISGTDITTNSITLMWESSSDTSSVKIIRDDILIGTVSDSTSYTDGDLEGGTTYTYTLIPYANDGLEGKAVSISLKTKSSSSGGGGSSGGSSSKKSSSGGGGSGAGSVEAFANIAVKDADNAYLRMGSNITYEFSRKGNDIQSVSFYSLKNSGEITSTIEVLNGRSKLVHSNPEGFVYRYLNIWVGKAGFATSDNIKDARIMFKVNDSWLEEVGVSPADVKLQRYNGSSWEVLPTTLKDSTMDYVIFEAQTPGFSPFAITAGKTFASTVDGNANKYLSQIEDIAMEGIQPAKSKIWTYIMGIILLGLLAVGREYLKKEQQD